MIEKPFELFAIDERIYITDNKNDVCHELHYKDLENRLNDLYIENHELKQEITSIRELIGNMMETEKTKLGKSVLIQLWEQIR